MQQLRRIILIFIFSALASSSARAADRITYEVRPDAAGKQFLVALTVPAVTGDTLRVQIPTWSPGAYGIRDYAKSIQNVEARGGPANGNPGALAVSHPDRLTWAVATNGAKEVRITYRVTGAEVEAGDGKPKHAHLSGPACLMYVVDRKLDPARIRFDLPEGWKIANSLDPVPGMTNVFDAPNYDVLADAPSEMGDFAEDEFTVRGAPHRIVLYGDYSNVDRAKLKEYCRRIAETEIAFFNDVPFKRYVFEFRCSPTGRGGGGLEHLGSTEISIQGPVNDRTRSVIAHEYFHLWNVKRIRPAVLGPFDYTGPNRTKNLWWFEGVTSYYGDLLSRRAGLNTDEEYLKHVGDTIGQLESNPSHAKVTAEEMSTHTWDADWNREHNNISYYTKGELAGLCLDLMIRKVTHDRRSLDDVERQLYVLCGKGNGPGIPEDAIRQTVNAVAGTDLSAFYDRLVRSTDEMPFAEVLGGAGLTAHESATPVVTPNPGMFAQPDREAGGLRVRFLRAGGAATAAGLQADDLIVAVDDKPVLDPANPRRQGALGELKPNEKAKLTVERAGKRLTVDFTMGSESHKPWIVTPDAGAAAEQVALREAWLAGRGSVGAKE